MIEVIKEIFMILGMGVVAIIIYELFYTGIGQRHIGSDEYKFVEHLLDGKYE